MAEPEWQRVRDVFERALDRAPDERAAFLDEACGADAGLRAEVESLLAHHAESEADTWDLAPILRSAVAGGLVGASLAGRYEVVGELGSGGMGSVYLATDRRFGKPVALKALSFASDVLRRAFQHEARLLNDLRHRALPVVIDYFAERDLHVLVMDYVPGDDLASALASRLEAGAGPFDAADILRWADQLLDALEYLHGHEPPVVHRDVKPPNLKLTPKGDVVLLDFGLAKGAGGAATAAPASVAGYTPNYAPLEQIRGTGTDPRSDLYALGATLYHLATGHLPPDACARAEAVLAGAPDPLTPADERNPSLPRALAALIASATALTRDERPSSAAEMRAALAAAAGAAPASPAGRARPNNLPLEPTSFVGRRRDVAAVSRASAADRLVTLVGPGGMGKTRLALKVAAGALGDYADGVWLVELASLADPGLVAGAAAAALGVRETEGAPSSAALAAALGERRALLVLDNCEHVIEGCRALARELLARCPGVRLLATSREALRVSGERAWPVPPLSLPDPGAPAESDSDAVALFVERARLAKPSFSAGADVGRVASICRRLEGIPLAIELAAARVRVLSLEQIDARLEDRFRLLTGGDADVPERHQTLRAAIDWSHEMLGEEERALLRRMSAFPAGCTLEAAEAVCAGDGVAPDGVLDLVAKLVDKSLVSVDERDGEARYRLLETIREYARERLRDSGEEPAVFGRLEAWAVELAAEAAPGLAGPDQRTWIARLEAEYDNLRAALDRDAAGGASCETSLALANHLVGFWHVGGRAADGCALLERALARCPEAPAAARADALRGAGTLANALGEFRRARELYEAGLELARAVGDPLAVGRLVNNVAITAHKQGEHEDAARLLEEALGIFREAGDARLVSLALNNLATVLNDCGDSERAVPLYEESLALKRRIGDRIGTATLLLNLAVVAQQRGDLERSRAMLEESLALRREAGDRQNVGVTLGRLARAEAACGDPERAATLLAEALGLQRKLGDPVGLCESLEGFVHVASSRGEWERALVLSGAAAGLRDALGAVPTPSDVAELASAVEPALAALGAERGEALTAVGRAMDLDEALDYAADAPAR